MARSYLKVFFDFEEKAEELSDSEKGNLLLAMLRYAKSGTLPVLSGNERFLFPVFRKAIDEDAEKYESLISNGSKGGRPKTRVDNENPEETRENQTKPNKTKQNQSKPEETKQNQINPEETKQYQSETRSILPLKKEEEEKERRENNTGRFTPPTIEEIAEYCRERNNGIDPQYFYAYYDARGWELSKGRKVKNWKSCIITWEKRNEPVEKTGETMTEEETEALWAQIV